ncbi:MAG: ATP-dependent helicase HrpB [Cyanobium sp. M30B3]|nr:MAG: ATP-dependent helicase HrpB [Cyanobium sp. M30B3]
MAEPLPIDALLPQLAAAVAAGGATVLLQAPPGAGKTTRVPRAVLPRLAGRVWMLEPRRIAARSAAQRIAAEAGEPVGGLVGYSVRLESRSSAATRIEVLTHGVFLRRLQADPSLEGVDCVIFDEFHERQAEADLALALLRQARALLHPELRLIVMSATLNLAPLAEQMPEARLLRSEGRSFPVSISHQAPRSDERLPQQLIRALEQHWLDGCRPGDTALVFLPGLREIQACARSIQGCSWSEELELVELHGNQPLEQQARAVGPAGGGRPRVVLATSLAESSLTIAGVTLVVDSGLRRCSRFDPARGLNGLVTVPASQASGEQRAGRAGRLGPGRCLRLWSPAEQQRRPLHDCPELLECDPLPLALQLAEWGDPLGRELLWLDAPPAAGLQEARAGLVQLGALPPDGPGILTQAGQAMARLGLHPRLARMLLSGRSCGQAALACELAVLLSERDPLGQQEAGADLGLRLDWLRRQPSRHPLQRQKLQWLRQLEGLACGAMPEGIPAPAATPVGSDQEAMALLVAAAFPERLALGRPGQSHRYLLRSGTGAVLHPQDPLGREPALAVASLDGAGQDARIQLAVPLSLQTLHQWASLEGSDELAARWDAQAGRVCCERSLRLGALVLERRPWTGASPEQVRAALLEGLHQQGLAALPWQPASRQLQHRLCLAHRHLGAPWPDRSDRALLEELEPWLAPWLGDARSLADLRTLDLEAALWGDLDWPRRQELEQLLPQRLPVPSGRSIPLDYSRGDPVLAVKLQEMFSCRDTPRLLDGRLPVTLHLLTPAGRAAAITQDLAGFWSGTYREVRRELRGRYPKHPWPEDGATAPATAFTKARLQRQSD